MFKENKPLKNDRYEIVGDTGTRRYSGYFEEDPNADWRDEARVDNVETMRRTDGTVKQLLNALKTPILSSEWYIDPVDQDKKSIEEAKFIEQNLFNMRRSWKDFLREALTYFDFGFSVFEEIWEKRDGMIYLADLSPRIQHSIVNWQIDQKGGTTRGITQAIMTDEINTNSYISIPLNKLLVLTNDKEGSDVTGQSVLRPAWKHFYIKDNLYKIASISSERYGVGIPIITLPEGAGETETKEAEDMAQSMRSNEKGFIILPNANWGVDILTPKGNPQSQQIMDQIIHHDRMIVISSLAGFLNLGANDKGSYALSQDQSSFFISHVEDKTIYLVEQMECQVIKRIMDVNFGERENYPKLRYMPLGDIDKKIFAETIKLLTESGAIRMNGQVRKYIYGTMGFPKLTEEEENEEEERNIDEALSKLLHG